jgi:hypothetical protein
MKLMGVDFGVLLETKLLRGVYRAGAAVITSEPPTRQAHGKEGLASFWRASDLYEVEEVELCEPYVLSFQLVLGATRYYIVGCYNPPNNLTTLMHVKKSMDGMPKRLPAYRTWGFERQSCCPTRQARQDDCQTGRHHELG